MQAGPPRRGEVEVERLADEGVGELVAAGVGLDDDAGGQGGIEGFVRPVGIESTRVGEDVEVELATGHGGDAEHGLQFVG